ncbi:MAG: zinc ribbon domain-containing protein [Bacteroidota bacterium]
MKHQHWSCPKCQNREFDVGQIATTGGGLSKFFNVQNRKFTTVTCIRCQFTELYRTESSTLGNVLDFFGN